MLARHRIYKKNTNYIESSWHKTIGEKVLLIYLFIDKMTSNEQTKIQGLVLLHYIWGSEIPLTAIFILNLQLTLNNAIGIY
jgi:hypothetical protein